MVDKVPDVVIPGDDPLDRVTDHIDIDWHVQVKPEWCKNEDTEEGGVCKIGTVVHADTHTRP